jgi:IS5 family transposase
MATDDFFRARLDGLIDLKHPLAVLATRLPWAAIEAAVAPKLARRALPGKRARAEDPLGAYDTEFGGGVSPVSRPRLPIRLMASLLYLKNSFNLSDEELVERWAENVQWQFFSGMDDDEPRLPCDATQIGRFRRLLGEDGTEQLFKAIRTQQRNSKNKLYALHAPEVEVHRGKYPSLSDREKRLLKRRQAIEPLIGHTKADHRMDRCWLQRAEGDALHALCCAAAHNIRWPLRAIARLGLATLCSAWSAVVVCVVGLLGTVQAATKAVRVTVRPASVRSPVFTSMWLATAV